MPVTAIFVRHGESSANVDRVFANRVGSPGDLTLAGIAQAEALATTLTDAGITAVSTSPLPRALQTARIIAGRLELPIDVTDALREYDVGDDEGHPYSGREAWRWERYEAVQRAWREGDLAARHPGGESLADILQRLQGFLQETGSLHGQGETILAVGHGGIFHSAFPVLLPTLPAGIAICHPLGHGDRVVAEFDGSAWHCEQWGTLDLPDPRRG